MESQLSPVNVYYHSNKEEWRSRYVELESKKTRHFSCKRYGYNRAYFLSNLYLRVVQDKNSLMSNEDLAFWYSIIKDFKSLEEVPQKVFPKPPTRTSNLNVTIGSLKKGRSEWREKCKFLEESNQMIFERTVSDLDSKTYVSNSSFPLPELCTTSMRNEAFNLTNLLRHYKSEIDKTDESSTSETTAESETSSSHREEPNVSIYDIFETVMNQEINEMKLKKLGKQVTQDKEKEKTTKESKSGKQGKSEEGQKDVKSSEEEKASKRTYNEAFEDILSLIRMNKRTYGKVSKLLNKFILKSTDSMKSYDFLDKFTPTDLSNIDINNTESELEKKGAIRQELIEQSEDEEENFRKINKKNKEIIEDMSKNFSGEKYYESNKKTFINTFNELFEEDVKQRLVSEQEEAESIDELEDSRMGGLYSQFTPSTSYTKANKEVYIDDDKSVELNKLCNPKLQGLMNQTEHLEEGELERAVYDCLEQESRSLSDLESLIRISSRGSKSKQVLYKSSRLYQLSGVYNDDYIDVVYKNGKIIPKSAMQFYAKSNNNIVLSGSDKLDVNMETVEKIFVKNYNQNETVSTIMENLDMIDDKLVDIVREYETMHRALYRYINSPEKDPESTNEVEELFNLETLHFVAETLLDTKLKFIQQVQSYYESQLNILESIMPVKYYNMFNKILCHPFNQF
ncbi:hypothetical protein MACK_001788 [Theileria orientalis]|uniref:Uncharacterized protein n=1 Tax=Theileria orientalis TaxID=68886 RepID=A0A976QUV1_THEOR|nr:hypothetical protein MACK_001788 [Theileria orientalis]